MNNNLFVYPYQKASRSAKVLAEALGARRIRRENSSFKGSPEKIVINWGCSRISDEAQKCRVINEPGCVHTASNKLHFFRKLKESFLTVSWTEDREEAYRHLQLTGSPVYARTKLTGHSGEGIVLCTNPLEEFPKARLYTFKVPIKHEWRVHVFDGKVIDIRRKGTRNNYPKEKINRDIRNHKNGYIYLKNFNDPIPKELEETAIKTVELLGLTFASVDMISADPWDRVYVLEANTASGLRGSTIENYKKAFETFLKEMN